MSSSDLRGIQLNNTKLSQTNLQTVQSSEIKPYLHTKMHQKPLRAEFFSFLGEVGGVFLKICMPNLQIPNTLRTANIQDSHALYLYL